MSFIPATRSSYSHSAPASYAHGHSSATLQAHSSRTVHSHAAYLLPYIKPGLKVLDIGCGPGSITKSIADIVGPTGSVVGLDAAETVIERNKGNEAVNAGNLTYTHGSVYSLPFPTDSFDIVFAHQVLVHLAFDSLPSAIAEMKRVCKPGGLVTFRDGKPDSGGHQVFPPSPTLLKTLDIIMQRTFTTGGIPDSAGYYQSIAQRVGFARTERIFSLDVFQGLSGRQEWGTQWSKRSGEDSYRQFALQQGLVSREELDSMPGKWMEWVEDETGWATFMEIEHLCWK